MHRSFAAKGLSSAALQSLQHVQMARLGAKPLVELDVENDIGLGAISAATLGSPSGSIPHVQGFVQLFAVELLDLN